MYDLLFKAAWHTLNTLALDPQWLGAKTAATMILHTWSQTLVLHPHVHCIVPNGGLDNLGNWRFPKKGNHNFLFPVSAMKKLYKGFFMQHLILALKNGDLNSPKDFLGKHKGFYPWKDNLYNKEWVVFTKKPFSSVHKVVEYLGRYSHRVALTNRRIISISDKEVILQYIDYRDSAKTKVMSLKGHDFIQRFCLHILPPQFRKIRNYGFLANASKAKSLTKARISLGLKTKELLNRQQRKEMALERLFSNDVNKCPVCKKGDMEMIFALSPNKDPPFEILIKIKKQ